EDGIRDGHVTGVQTCALPISLIWMSPSYIMQEGDIQIKGYPLRLPLDVLLVFTANPEDYTARGKIITPLKDRIGAEIRTHYPSRSEERRVGKECECRL